MSKLLKWWKRIKWIRRIIAIASIVTAVVSVYLWFSALTIYAGVRKQEDVGITLELSDGSTASSGDIQALLNSCEKIAKYMRDNNFRYYTHHPDSKYHNGDYFNNVYNEGNYDVSCCATYVAWCLQDAGFITNDMHTECVCWNWGPNHNVSAGIYEPRDGIWKIMEDSPEWIMVESRQAVNSEDDLKEGDILIYKSVKSDGTTASHTNIYAGNEQYWDAGEDGAGAFIGTTKTHSMNGYTCAYRHISMWRR